MKQQENLEGFELCTFDSKRCNVGTACDLQPYGISIASAGRYFFNLMKTQKPANKYENSTWSGASVSPLRGSY